MDKYFMKELYISHLDLKYMSPLHPLLFCLPPTFPFLPVFLSRYAWSCVTCHVCEGIKLNQTHPFS